MLYFFGAGPDGDYPAAPLIDANGKLYGTTEYGGNSSNGDLGTVYTIRTSGGENVLYKFAGAPDGRNPSAGLIDVNGTLYGTTAMGGNTKCSQLGCGTVFSITPSGVETVLHRFAGGNDGAYPEASLLDVNGTLYGTTIGGGSGHGTVFKVSTSGAEKVLYRFAGGSDGASPLAGLIDVGGTLYGTTVSGGNPACLRGEGCGTVFSMATGGTEKVLYRFASGSDGAGPMAALVDAGGKLYGTTAFGGGTPCTAGFNGFHDKGCGTVYRVGTTGSEKVLFRFSARTGTLPAASLIDVKGTLYGTTYAGGVSGGEPAGFGTVYSITTGGTESVQHSFVQEGDGSRPLASLIDVKGTLYGTTSGGSRAHKVPRRGTVFVLTP